MTALRDKTWRMGAMGNCVRSRRAAAGLRQQDLAARIGISRQSLSVLEQGHSVPSTGVALRLARTLGCAVEDLFWVDAGVAGDPITAELAADDSGPAEPAAPDRARALASRVMLGSVDGRWVAHRLTASDPAAFVLAADGIVSRRRRRDAGTVRVTPLEGAASARDGLLCAGCAPAFGILAARASAGPAKERISWLERSSGAALDLLAQGHVHVAGAHLFDVDTGEFNVPFVQRRFSARPMLVFNLARWEAGLVVAAGNPLRVRGVRDLARANVRFVQRQPGAAAQQLIERLLRREGLPTETASRGRISARGHMEVARLVALGVADTGVALAAVANANGLDFIPLAEERFDLVVAKDLTHDARVVRLLETLSGRGFRREIETLGGHVARNAGQLIADTSAATT
jgi:putative molybdopterin biosynthesis protein